MKNKTLIAALLAGSGPLVGGGYGVAEAIHDAEDILAQCGEDPDAEVRITVDKGAV